jgi:hypothetical protein
MWEKIRDFSPFGDFKENLRAVWARVVATGSFSGSFLLKIAEIEDTPW